jgi:hypothetical protein
MKNIIEQLQITADILNRIRADADVLLAIGAAISRIEGLIELINEEGKRCE